MFTCMTWQCLLVGVAMFTCRGGNVYLLGWQCLLVGVTMFTCRVGNVYL